MSEKEGQNPRPRIYAFGVKETRNVPKRKSEQQR